MQIGMIGLGRMGSSMVRRLLKCGHQCVVHDTQASAVAPLVQDGAIGVVSLQQMVSKLPKPRVIWLMVPAAVVDQALGDLVPLLDIGDVVVDGGNSYFRDDVRRGSELLARGIRYLDVGTSGGLAGLERGYCLMSGGDAEPVEHLRPIFSSLAPGVAAASLTPGRSLTISRSGGRWSIEVSAGSARGGIHAISLYWVADGMRSDIMFIIICIEAMWSFIIW